MFSEDISYGAVYYSDTSDITYMSELIPKRAKKISKEIFERLRKGQ